MKNQDHSVRINGHDITLTHPEKVLFPDSAITKGDLIAYYARIADHMLPFTKNRALTLQRFPDGITGEWFYQKNVLDYFPPWIKTDPVEKKEGGVTNYIVCNNKATLVYIANQACITMHVWLSKIDKPHYPDRMIFDLDPADDNFASACSTALLIKHLLEQLDLVSFVMTTGSKGLHVVVPIARNLTNEQVQAFAYTLATIAVRQRPDLVTLEVSKQKRGSRLFIDTLRNQFTATAVAPYCVRPKPGAPVATPLDWHEVQSPTITNARAYTLTTIFQRLAHKPDVWHTIHGYKQNLKKVAKHLEALLKNPST